MCFVYKHGIIRWERSCFSTSLSRTKLSEQKRDEFLLVRLNASAERLFYVQELWAGALSSYPHDNTFTDYRYTPCKYSRSIIVCNKRYKKRRINTFSWHFFHSSTSSHLWFSLSFEIYKQSFAQKLTGLVAGPTDAPPDDTPWYLRYGARGLGIVGAFCECLTSASRLILFANFHKKWFLMMNSVVASFSYHPVWILELFWSDCDKLCERIVGYHSNNRRHCGDVDWGASLLHVPGSCTKTSPTCWKPAILLSCCWLLHVSHYIAIKRRLFFIQWELWIKSSLSHFHFSTNCSVFGAVLGFSLFFLYIIERQYYHSWYILVSWVFFHAAWYSAPVSFMEWCHLAKSTYSFHTINCI